MELRQYYNLFMTLTQEDFIDFINPANTVGRLIQAHFVAMQLIVSQIDQNSFFASLLTFSNR